MSASLRNQYSLSHGITPLHLVPNAIDPAVFCLQKATSRDIDMMAAGSFEPLKQYDLYAEIIGALRFSFPYHQGHSLRTGPGKGKVEDSYQKAEAGSLTCLYWVAVPIKK
jgi:hypothetical protein